MKKFLVATLLLHDYGLSAAAHGLIVLQKGLMSLAQSNLPRPGKEYVKKSGDVQVGLTKERQTLHNKWGSVKSSHSAYITTEKIVNDPLQFVEPDPNKKGSMRSIPISGRNVTTIEQLQVKIASLRKQASALPQSAPQLRQQVGYLEGLELVFKQNKVAMEKAKAIFEQNRKDAWAAVMSYQENMKKDLATLQIAWDKLSPEVRNAIVEQFPQLQRAFVEDFSQQVEAWDTAYGGKPQALGDMLANLKKTIIPGSLHISGRFGGGVPESPIGAKGKVDVEESEWGD